VRRPPEAWLFPALRYRDADAALAFLKSAFGAEEKSVHRGETASSATPSCGSGTGW
jgi:uncharacterized glyoxalase superfamily protein PhnB